MSKLVDQPLGQRQLRLLDRLVRGAIDLLDRLDLVGIVDRVKHQALGVGANQDEMFLAAQREFSERDAFARSHRFAEQPVSFARSRLGAEVIRILEVDRIDRRQRDKLDDLDRVVVARLEVLELFVGEGDVTALFDLVAAHQLAAIDYRVVNRAVDFLLDPA